MVSRDRVAAFNPQLDDPDILWYQNEASNFAIVMKYQTLTLLTTPPIRVWWKGLPAVDRENAAVDVDKTKKMY